VNRRSSIAVLAVAASFVVAVSSASPAATPSGRGGTLWVVNKALNNVTAFNGATGAVVATIPVGKNPNSVVVANLKAYITNEDSNDVTVVSAMTHELVTTIPVPSRPHHLRRSRDGSRIYVAEYAANKIAVVDTATDKVVRELTAEAAAGARTHSAWLTRDGKWLLAANEAASSMTIVDLGSGAIVGDVPLGGPPAEVIAAPNGKTAYVSLRAGILKVIDLASRTVTADVTLPAPADTLQLTPDGKRLMVALRGLPAQLSVLDTKTLKILQTVDLAGAGTIAGHNWLSANGRYSFVAFEGGSTPGVAVVDHRTGTVVQTYPYPGGGRPHGVYYDDPAATEGPAVEVGPLRVRVERGHATFTVGCSADAIGFCHGHVTVASRTAAFSLDPGASTRVRLGISAVAVARLARGKHVPVRAAAIAIDQLGSSRTTTRTLTLLPGN
jgi:YVTN family beta-propeller protein